MWKSLALLTVVLIMATSVTAQTTQPAIQELPAVELAGIATFGTPSSGIFGQLWQHWPANVDNQPGVSTTPYCYGLALMLPTSEKKGEYSYMACGKVEDAAKAPKHLLHYSVPAGTFAIFKIEGGVPEGLPNLGPMIHYVYSQWLPKSDYETSGPFNLERYQSKDNTIELLIPIKPKNQAGK